LLVEVALYPALPVVTVIHEDVLPMARKYDVYKKAVITMVLAGVAKVSFALLDDE
jgi:hypothetical protein